MLLQHAPNDQNPVQYTSPKPVANSLPHPPHPPPHHHHHHHHHHDHHRRHHHHRRRRRGWRTERNFVSGQAETITPPKEDIRADSRSQDLQENGHEMLHAKCREKLRSKKSIASRGSLWSTICQRILPQDILAKSGSKSRASRHPVEP